MRLDSVRSQIRSDQVRSDKIAIDKMRFRQYWSQQIRLDWVG